MTFDEVMEALEGMGSEQTKSTYLRHGALEPFFGVKIGDMKKLVKEVKKDQELVYKLYDSGNYDAMYLAGLTVNPKLMPKATLEQWVKQANWYSPAEYTVANVTAESRFARELAMEWLGSPDELIAVAGWSAYANYVTITPDTELDLTEIRKLLEQVRRTVHQERNRVRYVMNTFVICVGSYVAPLTEEAKDVAEAIGAVKVDVGNTACKVPLATDYIAKVEARGTIGNKKKTCIC
ncbi:DNA alkylation repair protein [Paenibacillus glycanilyticus]|uniref:DNA alkylation repair protein n=1 Tax=Paenibacillus glycanilyticus TaxID=126569 RepID=UPI002040C3FB|nr:DNA alkylation repair protein [Paenibacillus glycanilyticus]MCM3628901.1 DNA alkylation repair protein [Paenibacillus glycanilyticus]